MQLPTSFLNSFGAKDFNDAVFFRPHASLANVSHWVRIGDVSAHIGESFTVAGSDSRRAEQRQAKWDPVRWDCCAATTIGKLPMRGRNILFMKDGRRDPKREARLES
jgi:hypothetical protein